MSETLFKDNNGSYIAICVESIKHVVAVQLLLVYLILRLLAG